jgi:tetratricopeptide (TPR) repeat protein
MYSTGIRGGKSMNKKFATSFIITALILISFRINKTLGLSLLLVGLLFLLYQLRPLFYLNMANKKYFNNEVPEALALYERAYNLKQSKPRTKVIYAYILLKQGEVEKADKILSALMDTPLNPRDKADVIMNYSLVLWKTDRLPEAIELLEKLYNNGFKNTISYQSLGFFYILQGDLQKALNFNIEAYDYSNADTSIMDNLALTYYSLDRYDDAIELYAKIVETNPTFVTPYYFYALCLAKKEKYEEALEMLNKALSCNFTYLSYVKKDQVEAEIAKLENQAAVSK